MRKISILNTSIATKNIGDEIIVDSAKTQIQDIFDSNTMFFNIPTHEVISRHSRRIINDSNFSFVTGTNLLSSNYHLLKANQWNINLYDALKINRVILMGVGWANYQKEASLLTKLVYNLALDNSVIHSVRDNYTKKKLNDIGITNVVNTACPTMWRLTPEHCMDIPKKKAEDVIMTITDYRKDKEQDKELIRILKKNYRKVYVWIQGADDVEYLHSLKEAVEIIGPTLEAFDYYLDSNLDIDYIGTRLHAGIRAMQKKRRSIIIGVDNRAKEKQKDFNINFIDRSELNKLHNYLNNEIETLIDLDFQTIENWKNQFSHFERIVK